MLSQRAFVSKVFSKVKLQKLHYYQVREEFKLSAQMAIRVLGKVCESYLVDKESVPYFRETGALVYDQQYLLLKIHRLFRFYTLKGRILAQLAVSNYHQALLEGNYVYRQAILFYKTILSIFYL